MKKAIKKILVVLGILGFARKLLGKNKYAHPQEIPEKYKNVDQWHLDRRHLHLVYDTSTWYSKKWFFPRYDEGKIHEPAATDIFIDQIQKHSTVLDIGGHLGYFSCLAGALAQNGQVHVFEMDPKCLKLIRKNLKINGLDNVSVHNYAVYDAKEVVKIPLFEIPNPGLIVNSNTAHEHLEVETIVMDDFLAENNINPDFIKIDIEGAEWKALWGMKKTLESGQATLLVEIHVEILQVNFNTDYKEIIKLLLDCGYTLTVIEHRSAEGSQEVIDLNSDLQGNTMILGVK